MRRLFQAVLGHPLFKVIVKAIVIQALNEQIRDYFHSTLTLSNCIFIKRAYTELIEGKEVDSNLNALKTINIPDRVKLSMINHTCQQLEATYQDGFTKHKSLFILYMQDYFKLASISGCDFCGFEGPIGLVDMLDDKVRQKINAQSLSASIQSSFVLFHMARQEVNEVEAKCTGLQVH